ncbi:hypothetical protein ABZX62_03265 [Streptomyces flavidovirens]|uniref:Transposase n=1 Tax=Streptomyces flavidovirens TaxID=67298 RepID=A0ABW6RG89_9ACTN
MPSDFLRALDSLDDLVIEDLTEVADWTRPTESFVCWAESVPGTPSAAARSAGLLAA